MNPNRREFFGAGAVAGARAAAGQTPKRPNVLFLIVDQWSPLAADGSGRQTSPPTPSLDSLAASGVRFDRAYSPYPVCSPCRASLFTGRMPNETGIVRNVPRSDFPAATAEMPALGELFRNAGYDTAYFGKEHSGGVAYRGFQEFGSLRFPGAGYITEGSVLDSVFVRDAIEYFHRPRQRPFLATVSLINPHDICYTPGHARIPATSVVNTVNVMRREYLRGEELPPLPANHHAIPPASLKSLPAIQEPWGEGEWRRYRAIYHLLIENTDWLIGRLLTGLREAGLEEDTLIVMTADHGDMMGAHRLVQKGVFYEEAARVPFIASWKGTLAGGRASDQFVSGVDILPTFCDFAGIRAPKDLPGRSIRPVLEGASDGAPEYLVAEVGDGRMVRYGPYKYLRYLRENKTFEYLFDLARDPGETRDIAGDPAMRPALSQGQAYLRQWSEKTGDSIERSLDHLGRYYRRG